MYTCNEKSSKNIFKMTFLGFLRAGSRAGQLNDVLFKAKKYAATTAI